MFLGKRTEIPRGIRDTRWTTKDKLDQYRGVLKLYDREKKIRFHDAVKLKNRVSWELGSFKADIKKYRGIVNDAVDGLATGRARNLLQNHKELRLKYHRHTAEDVCADLRQNNDLKRRQLDKLRYEKKRKMKQTFNLQFEHAKLSDVYARENETWKIDVVQQKLTARYQQFMAKHNAANAIHTTYASMLDILRKDAVHHEMLLNTLKDDRKSQCKVMLRATVMGQLAAETSDDIAEKYKRLTRSVWVNMKERERTLNLVREQVDDLWMYAKSLIRTESDTIIIGTGEETEAKTLSNMILGKEMRSLEGMVDRVKESLLVRSYRELFSRLEEQARQKIRLVAQFDRNIKERDSLLAEKNNALATLLGEEHSLVDITERHNVDKNTLLEHIEVQKKRKVEYENSRKESGELLMEIRGALQSMVAMLVCVRRGRGAKRAPKDIPEKKSMRESDEKDNLEEMEEQADTPIVEKIDVEGLALLANISRKVGALFGMSNFDLDKSREEKARDLYQTYVSDYCSKLTFDAIQLEPSELLVEHEVFDASVPTRAEIKLRSRQLVETHLRLE